MTEESLKPGTSLKSLRVGSKLTLAGKPDKKAVKTKAKTVNDLKLAFSEFYLSLVLIQNYQVILNRGINKLQIVLSSSTCSFLFQHFEWKMWNHECNNFV